MNFIFEFSNPAGCTERRALKAPILLAILLALCFLAAPASALPMPVTTDILDEQRARWTQSGITSYVYEGSALCFCLPHFVAPHRVTVTNGVVTELLFADTLLPDNDPGSLQAYIPIEGLFDFLQHGIDQNWVVVDAMFEPTLGYPLMLYTDTEAQVADDEYRFRIDSLAPTVPLPGTVSLLLLSLLGVAGFRRRGQVSCCWI